MPLRVFCKGVLYYYYMDAKKTILLVEDEDTMLFALTGALEQAGFSVLTATDGAQGLALALEKHPDLILTDLKMPKMGGLEMIHELRQDDWGKHVEIVILTNISDVNALDAAMKEGTFFYMNKSDSSMADVIDMVRSRLGSGHRDPA